MLPNLPIYLPLFFGLITLLTILWFYVATKSKTALVLIIIWTVLQSILGLTGVHQISQVIPPRIILFGIFPTIVFIIICFSTVRGRAFIDSIELKTLTYLHSIRIFVEIVLFLLFHYGVVSILMTFEGTNFDILAGLTAPLIVYLAFKTSGINKKLLLIWNIICSLLLFNVVITAALAFPSPFQQLAFDQPNIAILYFPFNLLPTVVVPIVFFSHFIAIRQLIKK
jgi:hypothetical protein